MLISPAGPLYIAGRQLVFSKAVRRVWTESGGGFGGGYQFDANYKAAFWEATGSPIKQAAAMKVSEKSKPCIHDRIIVLVFMEATGSP